MTLAGPFWAGQMRDPAFQEAVEDEDAYLNLKAQLVLARISSGLSVEQIAERMEISEAEVDHFENSADDEYYQRFQSYARAVGGRFDGALIRKNQPNQ